MYKCNSKSNVSAKYETKCGCRHLVLAAHRHKNTLTFLFLHSCVNDSVELLHLIVVYTA